MHVLLPLLFLEDERVHDEHHDWQLFVADAEVEFAKRDERLLP